MALVALLSLLTACSGSDSGEASCEPPRVRVSTASVKAGAVVTVDGELFRDGCADQGEAVPPPLTKIELVWRQGSTEVRLGEVDAASDGTLHRDVTVPMDAKPGEAQLVVGTAPPVALTVG